MFEKSFITDCEGPLTLNDNAFELCEHFIDDGDKLFKILSLYDDYLVDIVKKEGYKALALFVTDVFDKESYCFYSENSEEIIMNAFHLDKIYEGVKLDGILSRKAQILPYIMEILE